jgi:hypothetical protein
MGKVLHASGSGYFTSGFIGTECIEESGDSRNAIWTLENAMKLYWRVRSWSFSASGVGEEDGEEFSFSTNINNMISRFYSEPDDEFIPTPREEQLVCGFTLFQNPDNPNLENIIEVGLQGVFKVGDLYNPTFEGFVYDRIPGVQYFMAATADGQASSTISLFGGVLPIGAGIFGTGESVVSFTATLTPTLWWSYGGTYDTSTGEPL